MRYQIAYVDESDMWLNTFYQTFKNEFNVQNIKVNTESSVHSITETIFQNDFDAVVTDYLLEEEGDVSFNGNKIVESIRSYKPHFPIIMLTAYESQAINHMDDVHIIYGKNILDGESEDELELFKSRIKSNITNYQTRIEETKSRIEELSRKKNQEELSIQEEEELTKLFMLMDEFKPEEKDMPSNLIQHSSISALNDFVAQTKAILEELKKIKN